MIREAHSIRFVDGPWRGQTIITGRDTYPTSVDGVPVVYDIDHETRTARVRETEQDWAWASWPWQSCRARHAEGHRCERRRDAAHFFHAREMGMEILTWTDSPVRVLLGGDAPAAAHDVATGEPPVVDGAPS